MLPPLSSGSHFSAKSRGACLLSTYHRQMDQPWLQVTLHDYEGHMGATGVDQLAPLASLFAEALAFCRPQSVAVVGIAGGNGLQHIDPRTTSRIIGIDINADYLAAVKSRYPALKQLELHRLDMAKERPRLQLVEMVHAALLFEHTRLSPCLENCLSLAAPGGYFAAVLQLPSASQADVASTGFASIQHLKEHFALINPAAFTVAVTRNGFSLVLEKQRPLRAGKAFWMGIFQHKNP